MTKTKVATFFLGLVRGLANHGTHSVKLPAKPQCLCTEDLQQQENKLASVFCLTYKKSL